MSGQKGFGLVEVLISLLLASFIIAELTNHYVAVKRQYDSMQRSLDLILESQLVTDLIRDSIRRSGFTPCLNIDRLKIIDRRANNKRSKLASIEIPANTQSSLKIRRMNEYYNEIYHQIGPTQLIVSSSVTVNRKRSVLIADCYHGEVQNIKKVKRIAQGQVITLTKPLLFTYQLPAYLGEWIEETFFIHSKAGRSPALFYRLHHTDELMPHVESLFTKITRNQRYQLVEVHLDLGFEKKIILVSKVRAL